MFLRHSMALALIALSGLPIVAQEKPISRIIFGSCLHQDKPAPIWKAMNAFNPEVFIWLGDIIYADTDDMQVMRAKYDTLLASEGYKQILAKKIPILATWDDHDYGKNDAGFEYSKKVESQKEFLRFYGVSPDSPLHTQEGIYHSRVFGPTGKRIQVIMLDERYFRSPVKRGGRPDPSFNSRAPEYLPNTDADATILGERQWKWLEEELKVPAEIRLIGSSVQILSEDHPFEKWANFPNERTKLFKLISDTQAKGVIILSGDRHLAELSMVRDAVGYPLYDITSSGFNQAFKSYRPAEKNRHRVSSMSYGDNFGVITVDWTKEEPLISLQVRDDEGDIRIHEKIPLSAIQENSKFSMPVASQDQPKPSDGAIGPKEAREKVDSEVTVEMKVAAGRKLGTRILLNSEKDFRSKANFTISMEKDALTGKYKEATEKTFIGKTIRVKGKVTVYNNQPEIKLTDEKYLEILAESKKDEKK
jgi:alkaline phosphatase D